MEKSSFMAPAMGFLSDGIGYAMNDSIVITNACTHNLKNVSLTIPKKMLTQKRKRGHPHGTKQQKNGEEK